jgi:hypothetical protein
MEMGTKGRQRKEAEERGRCGKERWWQVFVHLNIF